MAARGAAGTPGDGPVSPFADKRGGPAVFSGLEYQAAWATSLALAEVLNALTDPGRAAVLLLEPRTLRLGGQVGFDAGLDAAGQSVRHEAKVRPQKDDVLELVRTLPALLSPGTGPEPEVVLVAGSSGPWFTALSALRDNAVEATGEPAFKALVDASGDERRMTLAAELGAEPWRAARLLGAPLLMPADALDRQVRLAATVLTASARAEALALWCAERLRTGAQARESLPVSVLAGELGTRGLLNPVLPVPDADDRVVQAAAVLSACASPLPVGVLAAALGLADDELLSLLDRQVRTGEVVVKDGCLSRPLTAFQVSPFYGGPLVAAVLDGLLALPPSDRRVAVGQAYNTYLLCRALLEQRPETVARAFHAYDKCVKGTGSLLLVSALARVSLTAINRLAAAAAGNEALRDLLWLRGHAQICGTTWVYQRVGLHERAAQEMAQARGDAERHGHADNLAFADKCQGRIARQRAEDLAAVGDHDTADGLYADSVRLLLLAHDEFDALVRSGAGYDDEPGECLSLAARTHLSAEDLDAAQEFSEQAHEALRGLPRSSKALADQMLLDVDIALARRARQDLDGVPSEDGASDAVEEARRLAAVCQDVIAEFAAPLPAKPEPGVNVGESEIRARAQRLLGVLATRLGDSNRAAAAFGAAADEFGQVQQTRSRYECELLALESSGGLPSRLAEVLDALDAGPGTRVEAHRMYVEEGAQDRSGSALEGLVRRAGQLADLRDHGWAEAAA